METWPAITRIKNFLKFSLGRTTENGAHARRALPWEECVLFPHVEASCFTFAHSLPLSRDLRHIAIYVLSMVLSMPLFKNPAWPGECWRMMENGGSACKRVQ